MTRLFANIRAPLDRVRALYQDIEAWAEWLPSIKGVEILERSDERLVARVDQVLEGRRIDLRMEYRLTADGFHERQLRGWLRKWEADWRFKQSPDGATTVAALEVDYDLGFLGLLITRRAVGANIRRVFEGGAREAEALLRRRAESAGRDGERIGLGAAERIRILKTATGLEIWLDDKRYVALPAD